jgi:hypothetical protein
MHGEGDVGPLLGHRAELKMEKDFLFSLLEAHGALFLNHTLKKKFRHFQ